MNRSRVGPLVLLLAVLGCGQEVVELAGAPAGSTAAVADAPERAWGWVPFEDARCANGDNTGMGINVAPESTVLLLYLQGGGACWDAEGCVDVGGKADHLRMGYGVEQFRREPNLTGLPLLNRDEPRNPFSDVNMAFVPYCTGDLHAGVQEKTWHRLAAPPYVRHHVGALNLEAFLRRLVPTFPNVTHVYLAGASAGGLGAALNVGRVAAAFPGLRVTLVDDSGPLVDVGEATARAWQDAWGPVFPADCEGCAAQPALLMDRWFALVPQLRVAFLTHQSDPVLAYYLGIPNDEMEGRLEVFSAALAQHPQARRFQLNSGGHVVLGNTISRSQGRTVLDWLDLLVNDDPAWEDAVP